MTLMSDYRIRTESIKVLSPFLTELLGADLSVKLKITGDSMYPLFRSGLDIIVLKKKFPISKYDILLYRRKNGEHIIHRVVNIKDNAFCMAGDNETVTEYPIYENQVIATVEGFYRNGKYISCGNLIYWLYSFLWVKIIPLRHRVLNVLKKLRAAVRSRR